MNQQLLKAIYDQLKAANVTQYVYFLLLPSEDLLQQLTATYELNNIENEDTFDSQEAQKTYRLKIKINAPSTDLITTNSIYIKQKVYALKGMNNIKHVKLIIEDLFYDSELKVYTEFQEYEILI
jgi:hypothetical protein